MRAATLLRPGSILFLVGLVAVAFAMRSALGDAAEIIAGASLPLLLAAFLLLIAGRGVLAVAAWVTAARALADVPARTASAAWLRAAIAKYVPGGIWQTIGIVDRLRARGVPTGRAASVVVVDSAASIVAALAVGLAALPALIASGVGGATWWLLLAVPALALLHPRVFAFAIELLRRVTGRGATAVAPSWPLVIRILAWQAAGWIAAGLSLALVLQAVGVLAPVAIAVSASSLSWVAGLLMIVAPAGLGVREAALVGILASSVSTDAALAAALLSRLMFVALDVGGVLVSFGLRQSVAHAA
jgi:glycosyltransferase 2 family protein